MAVRWIDLGLAAAEALGPRRGAPPAQGADPARLAVVMGGFMLVMFVVVGGTLVWAARRIGQFRDAMRASIGALGLSARGWMRGLAAEGQLGGRPIEVRTLPDARRVPSMLQVKLGARTTATLVVGPRRGSFARMLGGVFDGMTGRTEVELAGSLSERTVTADDPHAAAHFLGGPAGALAHRLTAEAAPGQIRFVRIEPGAVSLMVSGYVLSTASPAALKAWVDDLMALASLAEG